MAFVSDGETGKRVRRIAPVVIDRAYSAGRSFALRPRIETRCALPRCTAGVQYAPIAPHKRSCARLQTLRSLWTSSDGAGVPQTAVNSAALATMLGRARARDLLTYQNHRATPFAASKRALTAAVTKHARWSRSCQIMFTSDRRASERSYTPAVLCRPTRSRSGPPCRARRRSARARRMAAWNQTFAGTQLRTCCTTAARSTRRRQTDPEDFNHEREPA